MECVQVMVGTSFPLAIAVMLVGVLLGHLPRTTLVLPRSSGGSCGRDESDFAVAQIEAEADLTTAQAMRTMLTPPTSRQ